MLQDLAAAQALLVGAVLILAGALKLADFLRPGAEQPLVLIDTLAGETAPAARWGLIVIEFFLASQLVLGTSLLPAACVATGVLFIVATVALVVTKRRSPGTPCGCLGSRSDQPIDRATVARSAVLAVLAFAPLAARGASWYSIESDPVVFGMLAAQIAFLAYLFPELRRGRTGPAWRNDSSLRRAVREVKRDPRFRDLEERLASTVPADVWRERDTDRDHLIVLFSADQTADEDETYLAFAVAAESRKVVNVGKLHLRLTDRGWEASNHAVSIA